MIINVARGCYTPYSAISQKTFQQLLSDLHPFVEAIRPVPQTGCTGDGNPLVEQRFHEIQNAGQPQQGHRFGSTGGVGQGQGA